jgi:hypothetical protein
VVATDSSNSSELRARSGQHQRGKDRHLSLLSGHGAPAAECGRTQRNNVLAIPMQ